MIYANTGMQELPQRCEDCPAKTDDPAGGANQACMALVGFGGDAFIILRRLGEDKPGFCPLRFMGIDHGNGEDVTVKCFLSADGKVRYELVETKGGLPDGCAG
jgi:hypothetical protein